MLLGNFLLELLFVGQNVALPGCDRLFLTNPNFLCNLKMVEKKKKKKSRCLFSVDVKTYWTYFIPSLFHALYSNKHANEVGKVGLATIFTFSWFLRFMGKGQQKTTGAP